jgi:hypothetical protein
MQADFKNMVKEIFGYERIRDIPEEELMHMTRTYGYSPLLQFLYSRYLKEKNDRHYPASVARTAIYFSNPHWLHHQLQKNHLDWIEDPEAEQKTAAAMTPSSLPEHELSGAVVTEEIYETSEQDAPTEEVNAVSEVELITNEGIEESSGDADTSIIPEEIPEETAVKAENIYANTLLDDADMADKGEIEDKVKNEPGETANGELSEAYIEPQKEEILESTEAIVEQVEDAGTETDLMYPEFDTVEEVTPLLDADTGFDQQTEEQSVVAELLPPDVESPVESDKVIGQRHDIQEDAIESDADDTDGDETEQDQPAPGFRPISLPVTNENETKLSFEPLYVVDYFASQGVKLSNEEDSRDLLTNKLKSFTEWLKSMKRIHPEKLSHELDEKTELTIKTVAEHSNEKGEIITETMAEIFMKQGLVEKSMEVYEKLSLLYPSKSDYFAAKISALKAIGT